MIAHLPAGKPVVHSNGKAITAMVATDAGRRRGSTPADVRRLRAIFAVLGGLSAAWTVRIPAVKAKLSLTDGQLGLEVLGWGLASLIAMHFSAAALRRFGAGRVLRLFLPALAITLVPVGLADTFILLITAGVLFGLCYGLVEVSASVAATVLEAVTGRRLMGSMHAAWSIGAVAGGLLGAAGAGVGLSFTTAMLVAAGVGLVAAILTAPARAAASNAEGGTSLRRARMPVAVLWLGMICACAFLAEGTIADWSGVYLVGFAGTAPGVAALAYPMTEAMVIAARLAADRLPGRLSIRTILLLASVLGAAGMFLAATADTVPIAFLGFLIVGATIALVPPLAFSAAGAISAEQRGAAVGRVSTLGYGGFLVGPMVIGLAADRWTLATGLLIAAGACVVGAVGSLLLPRDLGSADAEAALPAEGRTE